jgi:O-antigen/teichoic acid export membrane protein
VAVYSVAYSLAVALTVLPYSMDSIFLPLMAGFHGRREMDKMAETTEAAQRWAFLIVIPPALVFMVMPAYILTAIFGETYAAGSAALALFALSMTISALYHPLSLALSSMRMVRRSMAAYIPGGVIFFALCFLLIPFLGMAGPPAALIVSSLFMLLVYYRETGAVLRLGGMGYLARMALGGAVTLALMLLAGPSLLSLAGMLPSFQGSGAAQVYLDKAVRIAYLAVPAALAFLLFGASVLLLRCLKPGDVAIFRRALRKMRVPAVPAAWLERVASHGIGAEHRARSRMARRAP